MSTRHLPPELLEDIFSQLSSSKSALYHLSLSCRTFYHLCKPFLYSYITIITGEQRRKLKQVRQEDAQLVRKLVVKGEKSSRNEMQMDGKDNSIGSGIIEELFLGELLDISVIEVLHLLHLYENVDEQSNFETLELRVASNLVELSIAHHFGGGSLWTHVLEDNQLCPNLARFGSCWVYSFMPRSRTLGPQTFRSESGEYRLLEISLYHEPLGRRVEVFATDDLETTGLAEEKKLFVWVIETSAYLAEDVPELVEEVTHVNVGSCMNLCPPPARSICEEMLATFRRSTLKPVSFLSLPFSRSDFTPDILSIFASIEDLFIELHFSRDEEEEDSISVIPQSFINFVEKRKKLREAAEENEKNAGDG
ncbi:hypothetical protein JCM5350_004486 [Sporobolomyces pararoseus]